MELHDSVVLLTGGSRGIGPVIAETLALHGANLALAARSSSGLHEVAQRIAAHGTKTCEFPVDLADTYQRECLIADVLKVFGRIDVLINNAGLETEGAFADLTWPAIRETIEVNLAAPIGR